MQNVYSDIVHENDTPQRMQPDEFRVPRPGTSNTGPGNRAY